jgi:hypothetical protein
MDSNSSRLTLKAGTISDGLGEYSSRLPKTTVKAELPSRWMELALLVTEAGAREREREKGYGLFGDDRTLCVKNVLLRQVTQMTFYFCNRSYAAPINQMPCTEHMICITTCQDKSQYPGAKQ